MSIRRLALLLSLVSLAAVRPPDSGWRLIEATDDLTGAIIDHRLILRAENWSIASTATLVVACGNHLPNAGGKSLLFFGGQPLEPFGNELAYAELRFDDQPRPIKPYLTILDYGDAVATPSGRRTARQVAFIGTDESPYFSRPLFDKLLSSGTLSVTYRTYGEVRRVVFRLAGLREALPQLPACTWTG